jgi:glycosyltransferase involved in cell wall biosynthesis
VTAATGSVSGARRGGRSRAHPGQSGERRRIRVAYLASSLKPGGAERQMLLLAERLPPERFTVDFITLSEAGPYTERARAAGARVFSLGASPPPGIGRLARTIRRLGKTLRYLRILRRGRYDIVDAWLFPTYDLAALTKSLVGVRHVVAGRRNQYGLDGRLGRLASAVERLGRHYTDVIVANSQAVADDTISREGANPAKVRIIRNGVELSEPLPPDRRGRIRATWNAGDDDVVIACVANYRDVKRLDVLIDAFALLALDRPGVHLVLVGEGPMRTALEAQVVRLGLEASVHLIGQELDPSELYGAFDVVALSSSSEGLPNALLEASAAGRPIVTTAVGGAIEVVRDGITGFAVAPDDPAALAEPLRRLADDLTLRETMGAAGRAHVAETFGVDRFVRQFGDLYEALARPKGG